MNTENFVFRPWHHACIVLCIQAQCVRVCCYFCYFLHLTGEEPLRADGLGTPSSDVGVLTFDISEYDYLEVDL